MSIPPAFIDAVNTQPEFSQRDPGWWQTASLIGGIILFLLLMAGAWLLLRWLSSKGGLAPGRSKHMRVLDRIYLSRDSQICLLMVSRRVFAVAVGKESSGLICELDPEDIGLDPEAPRGGRSGPAPKEPDGAPQTGGFWKRFGHNLKYNAGLLPKGSKPMTPPKGPESAPDFKAVLESARQRQEGQKSSPAPAHTHNSAHERRPAQPPQAQPGVSSAVRSDYNAIIENMRNLGLVDKDKPRFSGVSGSPQQEKPAAPQPAFEAPMISGAVSEKKAEAPRESLAAADEKPVSSDGGDDKFDAMFDLIARRQSRYIAKKERKDDGADE